MAPNVIIQYFNEVLKATFEGSPGRFSMFFFFGTKGQEPFPTFLFDP